MKKFLLLAVIVLFIVVLFLTVTHVMQKSHVEESVNTLAATESRWELQPINLGTISIDKNLTGRVRIEGVVKIGSEVNGRLKSLTVEEGSKVLKGELLAEIDDEKLQATFKLRKASLSSKKALLASVTLRKEEALRNFQRAKKIQPSGIISIAEFERLEFEHSVKEAQVKAIQADVDIAQAALDEISVDLTRTKILSPTDGEITAKHIEIGETVNVRQSSVTLFQVTPDKAVISIYSELPEKYIQYVRENYPVKISSKTLAPAILECFISKKFRHPIVRQEFVFYGVLIKCNNPPDELWAGMTVNVNLEIIGSHNKPLIEHSSFIYEPDSAENVTTPNFGYNKIWVKTEQGELKQRSVIIGLSNKQYSEVLAGDLEVTDYVYTRTK